IPIRKWFKRIRCPLARRLQCRYAAAQPFAPMIESIWQDIRVGLRILFKEKSFCFLAVFVLALGVCGVTTQFTVINAVILRGFSFPHPEQLASVGLLDSRVQPQNNNFGAGNIPSAQDYEDLRASQQSFSQMAAYLNGSTINVSYRK